VWWKIDGTFEKNSKFFKIPNYFSEKKNEKKKYFFNVFGKKSKKVSGFRFFFALEKM